MWDESSGEVEHGVQALWWKDVVSAFREMRAEELPEDAAVGAVYESWCIDVDRYLSWLLAGVQARGGRVLRREVGGKGRGIVGVIEDVRELLGLKEAERRHDVVFVNATGIAARWLVPDETVYPTRGQTVTVRGEAMECRGRMARKKQQREAMLKPDGGTSGGDGSDEQQQHSMAYVGSEIAYAIPRPYSGTTILGGCAEPGNWDTGEDVARTANIVEKCKELAPELLDERTGEFDVIRVNVGLRPSRIGGPRVESQFVTDHLGAGASAWKVVHCYGHAGAGYQNSVGCAAEVVRIVKGMVAGENKGSL